MAISFLTKLINKITGNKNSNLEDKIKNNVDDKQKEDNPLPTINQKTDKELPKKETAVSSDVNLLNTSSINKIKEKENKIKEKENKIKEKENKIEEKENKIEESKRVNDITFKELKGAKFKCGNRFKKGNPHWVVVHYTAMAGVSAEKCTKSFANTTKAVSTHFFCDSKEVYRVVDEKHIAWHVRGGQVEQPNKDKKLTNQQLVDYGDKNDWRYKLAAENHLRWIKEGKDFTGNDDSFGVDLCCTKTSKKTLSAKDQDWNCNEKAIENAAKTVAYLCKKYNIDLDHVIRHADATGKPCLPVNNTEIFTPNGFIPLDKIKKEDVVYQYNLNENKIEKTKVIDVVEPYLSKICKNREYEATLNHRTLYRDVESDVNGYIVKTEKLEYIKDKEPYLFTLKLNNDKSVDEDILIENTYKLNKNYSFYEDYVSCVEVESGYIVIRQNGVIFITGNCPRPLVSLSGDKDPKLNDHKWEEFKQLVKSYL